MPLIYTFNLLFKGLTLGCIHSQLWQISPLSLRAFFFHRYFTEICTVVLNLKECRSSSLWNPDISLHFCSPQQTPRWLQSEPLPSEGTETEIAVVVFSRSLPAHWNPRDLRLFHTSDGGEGNILPLFPLFPHWLCVQWQSSKPRPWKRQSLPIPFLWWLGKYVAIKSPWKKMFFAPISISTPCGNFLCEPQFVTWSPWPWWMVWAWDDSEGLGHEL